jgi:hypothetical protein
MIASDGQKLRSGVLCPNCMATPGAPLKPIPPSVRWAGRIVGWTVVIGSVAIGASTGDGLPRGASWFLGGFTVAIALETHRWLPTQNTVAAAALISLLGSLMTALLGSRSPAALKLNLLIWFSHLLASRGLTRYLLRPWRSRSGYGVGVLVGTTLLSGVSIGLSQAIIGLPISITGLGLQWVGTGVALLAASVWLLVKKPVPELPNPFPAGLWLILTLTQLIAGVATGHPVEAALAGTLMLAAFLGIYRSARTARRQDQ